MPDDALMHYGVLGMKWGKRRGNSGGGSTDYKRARRDQAKGTKNLSDNALKKLVNRQNLEQQYARMNPSAAKRGAAKVKGLIAAGGTAIAVYNMVQSPAGKAAVKMGKTYIHRLTQKAITA